ncbi:putative Zn-dependent peptidase [Deinococcus sp. HSC-46F16]|uniref:M16 family metallopeptidase n=1 Tax=Deinococcus sp. HSC-46F16 TaxID=2910968 RepID=UPI0020A096DD|nr:pitrilysin family protein [Deinococcus sp. HSC-46F16]MCP2015379.1 putative Zn-dependent peptidase [Deinococcus sp. HSC-46F16]
MTLRERRLPNGLTLLLDPDEAAQTVAAGYFVATGAREEHPDELGASHFLEHLMFKGSKEVPAAELNARLDDLGGHANAFTGEEATVYHAATLPEQGGELLDTLTELLRPALRPADIEAERGVILEEIAMYAEQPAVRVADELRADYWGGHGLGHPILGTPETVGGLTREMLARNWQERYGAGRVTLTVVGAFDPDAVEAWAVRELASWPSGLPAPVLAPAVPRHPGTFRFLPDENLSRVQASFALPGVSARHPLREAAAVLAELIGGENGDLYWALLDTGLADSADLAHLDYTDAGTFEGGFSCDPERFPEVQATYLDVLRRAGDRLTPERVRRAARKLAVSGLLRAETPGGRLFALGMDALALGEALTTDEQVARFERVSLEEVRSVLELCPLAGATGVGTGPEVRR